MPNTILDSSISAWEAENNGGEFSRRIAVQNRSSKDGRFESKDTCAWLDTLSLLLPVAVNGDTTLNVTEFRWPLRLLSGLSAVFDVPGIS